MIMKNCIFFIFLLSLSLGTASCSKQVCPTYMTLKEVDEMQKERVSASKKIKQDKKGRVKGRHKHYNR